MSNRYAIDKSYSLVKGRFHIYAAVNCTDGAGTIALQKWNYPQMGAGSTAPGRTYTAAPTTGGGTSFPTRNAQGAEGVFSVVRTGAGRWTVTLANTYQRLLDISGFTARAGGTTTVADFSEDTTVSNYAAAGGSIIGIVMFGSADTPADPASGDQIRLHFELQDLTTP